LKWVYTSLLSLINGLEDGIFFAGYEYG